MSRRGVPAPARRGYEVDAFEPSGPLVAGVARHIPEGLQLTAYRANDADLAHLAPTLPGGEAADLTTLPRFDPAYLDLGSLSHLLSEQRQVAALRAISAFTDGPGLISFRTDPHAVGEARSQLEQLKRRLSGRNTVTATTSTCRSAFTRPFGGSSWDRPFAQAGSTVEKLDPADSSGLWGHAVFSKR